MSFSSSLHIDTSPKRTSPLPSSTEDGKFADTDVTVNCDGHEYTVPAGTQIKLTPGESITIYPYMYHDFHVEEGSGDVLLGEVSMCNDDENDNRFYEPLLFHSSGVHLQKGGISNPCS